jgi:hypothetical protein
LDLWEEDSEDCAVKRTHLIHRPEHGLHIMDNGLVAAKGGAGADHSFVFQSLQGGVSETLAKPTRVEDACPDGLHSVVLSKYMQLIFGETRGVRAKGKERVCLEEGVSEVEDENVGPGVIELEPILWR